MKIRSQGQWLCLSRAFDTLLCCLLRLSNSCTENSSPDGIDVGNDDIKAHTSEPLNELDLLTTLHAPEYASLPQAPCSSAQRTALYTGCEQRAGLCTIWKKWALPQLRSPFSSPVCMAKVLLTFISTSACNKQQD